MHKIGAQAVRSDENDMMPAPMNRCKYPRERIGSAITLIAESVQSACKQ
jgi:hypothetical protein